MAKQKDGPPLLIDWEYLKRQRVWLQEQQEFSPYAEGMLSLVDALITWYRQQGWVNREI